MITTICYGQVDTWAKKEDAIKYFMEAADCSEGAERDRYMNIILDLLYGEEVATDGVD